MLKSILSKQTCKECGLCCNYSKESLWESPCISKELAARLTKGNMALDIGQTGAQTFHNISKEGSKAVCPMFREHIGCILPDDEKPFECRIWPVRVMLLHGAAVITLYKDCPGIQGHKREELEILLDAGLKQVIAAYIGTHPECIRPYNSMYDPIMLLE
jgi:Fe-S-cluster containining protein